MRGRGKPGSSKKGPLFGLCPPGWPTSTLFMSALRSDISRACEAQTTPGIAFVQQAPRGTVAVFPPLRVMRSTR